MLCIDVERNGACPEERVDLFTIATAAIAVATAAVSALGYCLWCLLDEPQGA